MLIMIHPYTFNALCEIYSKNIKSTIYHIKYISPVSMAVENSYYFKRKLDSCYMSCFFLVLMHVLTSLS